MEKLFTIHYYFFTYIDNFQKIDYNKFMCMKNQIANKNINLTSSVSDNCFKTGKTQ